MDTSHTYGCYLTTQFHLNIECLIVLNFFLTEAVTHLLILWSSERDDLMGVSWDRIHVGKITKAVINCSVFEHNDQLICRVNKVTSSCKTGLTAAFHNI